MNKTVLYLLLLFVLGAAAYIILKKPWGTLKQDETAFAVEDTASIGKILIGDMQGHRIVLERKADEWVVNEKFPARSDYVNLLLSTIRRVAVSYPVPDAARNKVLEEMASHNKKVEIFDRSGNSLRSYFVGGASLDALGTYMLMEGAENPYVTALPGFQGTLQTRYVTDEEKVRDRTIYAFKPGEISQVKVDYQAGADSSFTISVSGMDSFQLISSSGKVVSGSALSKDRVRNYLNEYKEVIAEAFVNSLPKKDTILRQHPFCTITVTDRGNQQHQAVCYYMPVTRESSMHFDEEGNPLPYDLDRYFAVVNQGNDFVIIQEFHFGRLFKSYRYFLADTK